MPTATRRLATSQTPSTSRRSEPTDSDPHPRNRGDLPDPPGIGIVEDPGQVLAVGRREIERRVLVAHPVLGDLVGVDPVLHALAQLVPTALARHEAEPGP